MTAAKFNVCRRCRDETMNFLIVDDNAPMRRMIRTVIEDLAGEINECGDGADAVANYAAHSPDWVLMDIRMKHTDGLTATKAVKARFADAKIIIVTNYDDADLRESARAAGACGYVLKENLFDMRRILTLCTEATSCCRNEVSFRQIRRAMTFFVRHSRLDK